jgi:inner membrane protein
VENLTHSLVGAALAEAALPALATRAQRTLFFTASVLAANLPDGDLLYSGITLPPPLGYLLHHRGYTHTVVGCLALACLVGAFGFIPAVRERLGADRQRWWILIVVALLSHITLDWWNSYGVHPFWPFDDRWYYGDAINIFEPLLWVMLGVVGAMNAVHFVSRALVFLLVVGGVAGVTALGLIRTDSAIAAGILVVVLLLTLWRVPRRARAAVSLALSAVFVIASFAMSHVARTTLIQLRQRAPIGDIIDVVLTPAAANPFSWSAVTIEHDV